MNSNRILQVDGICKSYGSRLILDQIGLNIQAGECFGIIGPNGSGKSTLVKLLSGADQLSEGQVLFLGKPIRDYTKKQLAQHIAVLQQEALPAVGFTVREVVEMGRYPYQNWLGEEQTDAGGIIDAILADLDLSEFADRPIEHLSGGERQRVALAKAVAQQPMLLMLDEPTTYLDIGYQQQMMDYIARWRRKSGLTVLAVLHDLNLAAIYCDRMMVVHNGRVVETGTPEQIMRVELLEQVYGVRPAIVKHPASGVPQVLLQSGTDDEARL